MIRSAARAFAQNVIRPQVPQIEAASSMTPEFVASLFEQGFMSVEVPEEYSGVGGSFQDSLSVVQEIAKVEPACSLLIDIQNTLIQPMMHRYANDDQGALLVKLATDTVGCFALSEAGSGSDAFALKTSAKDGDGTWTLTAAKCGFRTQITAASFLFSRIRARTTATFAALSWSATHRVSRLPRPRISSD